MDKKIPGESSMTKGSIILKLSYLYSVYSDSDFYIPTAAL